MSAHTHFYKPLLHVEAKAVDGADRERAIRAYCDQLGSIWALQIRCPLKRRTDGQDGKDFIVSTAHLDVAAMKDLRTAITALLVESGVEEPTP